MGEVDIDFHKYITDVIDFLSVDWIDHRIPSNSDPGSVKDGNHSHLANFNMKYDFFGSPLKLNYEEGRNHEQAAYTDAYCE